MEKVLSIGIPSYNAERYIARCLDSLLRTSNRLSLDIIVVNDGSKDGTLSIANDYHRRYPDIVRVIDKENGGHGSGINVSWRCAVGKYYRVLDSDDWVDHVALDKLIDYLRDCQYDMVHTNYHRVNMVTGYSTPITDGLTLFDVPYSFEELRGNKLAYFSLPSITYKTEILKQCDLKIQEKMFYVDVEYHIFPLSYVTSIINLNLYVYKYMVGNEEQSINAQSMVKRYDDHNHMLQYTLDYLKEKQGTTNKDCWCYIKNIMLQVIRTNYVINWFYNEREDDAKEKLLAFDNWLSTNHHDLWTAFMRKNCRFFLARVYRFERERLCASKVYKIMGLMIRIRERLHKVTESSIVRMLLNKLRAIR